MGLQALLEQFNLKRANQLADQWFFRHYVTHAKKFVEYTKTEEPDAAIITTLYQVARGFERYVLDEIRYKSIPIETLIEKDDETLVQHHMHKFPNEHAHRRSRLTDHLYEVLPGLKPTGFYYAPLFDEDGKRLPINPEYENKLEQARIDAITKAHLRESNFFG